MVLAAGEYNGGVSFIGYAWLRRVTQDYAGLRMNKNNAAIELKIATQGFFGSMRSEAEPMHRKSHQGGSFHHPERSGGDALQSEGGKKAQSPVVNR